MSQPDQGLPPDFDASAILAAMSQATGYLDITPGDALELYRLAYEHARTNRVRRPVRQFMTSPVHSARPGLPAPELAQFMARHGVSGVPVVDGETLLGVVSIKDFLTRLGLAKDATPMTLVAGLVGGGAGGGLCALSDLSGLTARDLMTAPARSIAPETPLGEAARLMDEGRMNRLPVVDEGRLVGIITRSDLVRAFQPGAIQPGARP